MKSRAGSVFHQDFHDTVESKSVLHPPSVKGTEESKCEIAVSGQWWSKKEIRKHPCFLA
jgi:hypothetical protein